MQSSLSLSISLCHSWRRQTRLRGCYPYAVFFENRQPPSLSCSARALALALALALVLGLCLWCLHIRCRHMKRPGEPKPQQSAASPQSTWWWWWWCCWCVANDVQADDSSTTYAEAVAHACTTMMKLWAQKHLHSLCITFYFHTLLPLLLLLFLFSSFFFIFIILFYFACARN